MTLLVRGLEEVARLAEEFVRELVPATNHATVVTLSGELGAGKTTFVQALAKTFGVEERVTSPTFVIEKIYRLPSGPFKKLVHIDAYRFESTRELDILGWKELVADPGHLIVLEWPERVADDIPVSAHRITLKHIDEHTRSFTYDRPET